MEKKQPETVAIALIRSICFSCRIKGIVFVWLIAFAAIQIAGI